MELVSCAFVTIYADRAARRKRSSHRTFYEWNKFVQSSFPTLLMHGKVQVSVHLLVANSLKGMNCQCHSPLVLRRLECEGILLNLVVINEERPVSRKYVRAGAGNLKICTPFLVIRRVTELVWSSCGTCSSE